MSMRFMQVVNGVLDRAERTEHAYPLITGALIGLGIVLVVIGLPLAWAFTGSGLARVAIRPAGTWLRRLFVRELHRMLDADIRRTAP